MTNYAAVDLPGWLDPLAHEFVSVSPNAVYRDQLAKAGQRVLGEPLTAQRIVGLISWTHTCGQQ